MKVILRFIEAAIRGEPRLSFQPISIKQQTTRAPRLNATQHLLKRPANRQAANVHI